MISETIFTNTHESNISWLQAYTEVLSKSSESEKAHERRDNYTHPTQTYADYLDYKEEWQYATDEMLTDAQKSYIFRMASTTQSIRCDCGFIHKLALTTSVAEDAVIVDDPHTTPWTQCWFKTITKEFKQIRERLAAGAAEFPNIIAKNIQEIVQWKLAKTGRTPTLLPYETYKEVWWNIDVAGGDTDLSVHIVSLMRNSSRRILTQRQDEVRVPMVQRYFFTTQEIIDDHGFYNFIKSQKKIQGDILKFVNRLRRQVGYYSKNFKALDIERAISSCTLCTNDDVHTSPFAIYSAPPGAGKTTAQSPGLLVGFDTDWIGIGPTWRDYSYLLRKGIPIITNQPQLFLGAGVKILVGLKHSIRKDARGKPMANFTQVKELCLNHPDTYVLFEMENKKFLADFVIQMTAIAHIINVNLSLQLNKRSIWDASDGEKQYLNEFGRRMRDLAVGRSRVFELHQ